MAFGGLGGGLQLGGAATSWAGGMAQTYGDHKAANKARKNRIRGLQKAKNEFTLGSQDTQGNQYNFNNKRGWGYDLSRSGKAEVQNANRQNYLANAMGAKLPSAYRNQINANDYRAAQQQANANQGAASKMGLRTGSNLGQLSASNGMIGSDYLRRAMADNMRSGQQQQAQAVQNYLSNAANAKALTQSTMSNLQAQQAGAPTTQMNLNAAIAEATAVPARNWWQTGGKMLQGTGQTLSNLGGQVQKEEQAAQNQQLLQQLLSKASQTRGNGGGNTMDFSALLKLLPMLMSGAG